MSDEVDSFASMFLGPPATRRQAREARAQKERRAQRTEKQRQRTAVRTTSINFRCAPEFKDRLSGLQEHLPGKPSFADILEDALEMFARSKGYSG